MNLTLLGFAADESFLRIVVCVFNTINISHLILPETPSSDISFKQRRSRLILLIQKEDGERM
jgi:hypothetical protein